MDVIQPPGYQQIISNAYIILKELFQKKSTFLVSKSGQPILGQEYFCSLGRNFNVFFLFGGIRRYGRNLACRLSTNHPKCIYYAKKTEKIGKHGNKRQLIAVKSVGRFSVLAKPLRLDSTFKSRLNQTKIAKTRQQNNQTFYNHIIMFFSISAGFINKFIANYEMYDYICDIQCLINHS